MITPTGPLASGSFPAVLGVYRRLSLMARLSGRSFPSGNGGNRPLAGPFQRTVGVKGRFRFSSRKPDGRGGARRGLNRPGRGKSARNGRRRAGALRAWWSRFGPGCAAPSASSPAAGMLTRAFRRLSWLFSRILSLSWPPASIGRRTCLSLPSVVNAGTGENPLWGGSSLNQDACVNYLIGFAGSRSGDEVIHVYSNPDLGGEVSRRWFRS